MRASLVIEDLLPTNHAELARKMIPVTTLEGTSGKLRPIAVTSPRSWRVEGRLVRRFDISKAAKESGRVTGLENSGPLSIVLRAFERDS